MSININSEDVNRQLRNYESQENKLTVISQNKKKKKKKYTVRDGYVNYPVTLTPDGISCVCSSVWCNHRIKVILAGLGLSKLYLYFYTSQNWKLLFESNFSSECYQKIEDGYLKHECLVCFDELTKPKKKHLDVHLYQCHQCLKLTCQECIDRWTHAKTKKEDTTKITSCPFCRTEKPPRLPI